MPVAIDRASVVVLLPLEYVPEMARWRPHSGTGAMDVEAAGTAGVLVSLMKRFSSRC